MERSNPPISFEHAPPPQPTFPDNGDPHRRALTTSRRGAALSESASLAIAQVRRVHQERDRDRRHPEPDDNRNSAEQAPPTRPNQGPTDRPHDAHRYPRRQQKCRPSGTSIERPAVARWIEHRPKSNW